LCSRSRVLGTTAPASDPHPAKPPQRPRRSHDHRRLAEARPVIRSGQRLGTPSPSDWSKRKRGSVCSLCCGASSSLSKQVSSLSRIVHTRLLISLGALAKVIASHPSLSETLRRGCYGLICCLLREYGCSFEVFPSCWMLMLVHVLIRQLGDLRCLVYSWYSGTDWLVSTRNPAKKLEHDRAVAFAG